MTKFFCAVVVVVISIIALPGWIISGAYKGIAISLGTFVERFKTVWGDVWRM